MLFIRFLICFISVFPLSSFADFPEPSFWDVNSHYPHQSLDKALVFAQQMDIQNPELAERLHTGLIAAQKAGNKIREIVVKNNGEIKFITKSDGTPVTAADYASSQMIYETITQSHPQDMFISEENDEEFNTDAKYSWAVDPIDGTYDFTKKGSDWGIHIAVIMNNRPVVGINYYPVLDRVYFGVLDGGS